LEEGAGKRCSECAHHYTLTDLSFHARSGLLHATDWLPTLLRVAGARDVDSLLPCDRDGFDQWRSIRRNEPSRRTRMVYELDTEEGYGAVRIDNWKLVSCSSDLTQGACGSVGSTACCFLVAVAFPSSTLWVPHSMCKCKFDKCIPQGGRLWWVLLWIFSFLKTVQGP